jgi:hypothetical protein
MGTLAGIDLLGKFVAGEDRTNRVGSRFRYFLSQYLHLAQHEAETIYQLRNSMLHSFGLYSRAGNITYRFCLIARNVRPMIQHSPPETYLVDIFSLHADFENAIDEYRRELETDPALQQNFVAMFPNNGAIPIWPLLLA